MRFVALDVGDRRIGLATGDAEFRIAFPNEVFQRGGDPLADARALAVVCREQGADEILVGVPLNANGAETEQSKRIREFARLLEEAAGIPVCFRNEAMTTLEAERIMTEAGATRRKRTAAGDSVAAGVLLQEHLDELNAGA
jgi:putative Holliday junction resolvase